MHIHQFPVLSTNYTFMLHDPRQQIAAVVDPAEAGPILNWLKQHDATLTAIFNTHHHRDHVGGNRQLLRQFPTAVVYGGANDQGRIPGQQVLLDDGDQVPFGDRTAEVSFVPGHTSAHIAYYFPPSTLSSNNKNETEGRDMGDLFCGDTLFAGGCGRLFEGTPAQMVESLGRLRSLPDTTHVWCAHEYTLKNLTFALTVDPDNLDLHHRFEVVKRARERNQPTVPSLLGLEKRTNPFLRWDTPAIQTITGYTDPAKTFGKLRGMKDLF